MQIVKISCGLLGSGVHVNMLLKSALFRSNKIMASNGRGCKWLVNGVNGFLMDVYGVLFDSGSKDVPVTGSIEAVRK